METTKNEISSAVDGKIICFDDDRGNDYLYLFFDQSTDELCAGDVFNAGISRDYSIDYDYDFSIDDNVQSLYYHIIEKH